ncbi:MAG: 4-hydroxy-3-methylbut-2-enyl diphosphate reductase [Chthoniobacterales bacterium]|nr:4-hydroxy-3-methylbut-2-enyl diphosphate reductase [Chthoniobacterales bacterium]
MSAPAAPKRVNLRTPEVMETVQAAVEQHYHSPLVDRLRANGGTAQFGDVVVRLAKQFGFCYGVERAIDLAYAARKVFADRKIFLVGEIIHNPDVNAQLASMGVRTLAGPCKLTDIDNLSPDDVVIIPAFGAEVAVQERIKERGCRIVDTTCGDVMSVWKRVRQYANDGVTSIIHGKADHEETRATSSRARDAGGHGHFVVVYDLAEADTVCAYIRGKGDRAAFLEKFSRACSAGFDPDLHLAKVGVANQTTMLRSETEEVQRRVREAVVARDGNADSFRVFDTICGATQERQDALGELLRQPPDLMLVVGGYNSSNTTHLADMAAEKTPSYFVVNASCLESPAKIRHFDTHRKEEIASADWMPSGPVILGITAGASCPGNLIEDVLRRFLELRGIALEEPSA